MPSSFNFYGPHAFVASPAYRQGPIYVAQPSVITNVTFVSQEPVVSGFRIGFAQYDAGFHDSFFFYAGYGYFPYNRCVSSPWYYYPQLPPYLSVSVVYVDHPPVYPVEYDPYVWYPPAPEHHYTPLDYTIEDIVTSFNEHDVHPIAQHVPGDGDVAIYLDGSYRYSIRSRDFGDMIHDSVSDVHTIGYHIESVRKHHGGTVVVRAKHSMVDAWGNHHTVYQMFRLQRVGDSYYIREFGTSQREI